MIIGQYLTVGREAEPAIHLLGFAQRELLDGRVHIARKHQSETYLLLAYHEAFGEPVEYALPCWIEGAMVHAASSEWAGPHADAVRTLAAQMVKQHTAEKRGKSKRPLDGGWRAKIIPPTPAPKRPGGAAVKVPELAAVRA